MKNNRVRSLVIAIGIGLLLLIVISAIIYLTRRSPRRVINTDSCPRPHQYAANYDFDYRKRGNEYRNLNSSIDYFRLSLSWSPAFCDGNSYNKQSFQCQHSFGFIVHGLWPSTRRNNNPSHSIRSHPRNCRNEEPMPLDVIRKHFCIMPSETLMQAEWEKHGTCFWQKPEDYFEQINSLYSKIHIPKTIDGILSDRTLTKRTRKESIEQSFLDDNPQLKSNEIEVIMGSKGQTLKEVAFCYDRSFNHIKCE